MVTMEKLKNLASTYHEELSYTHPFVNSDKFVDNSYKKWACQEILKEIEFSKQLPFNLTPIQLLDQFSEKMKKYACMNTKNSLIFTIASETAEYLIEECWLSDWKEHGRR